MRIPVMVAILASGAILGVAACSSASSGGGSVSSPPTPSAESLKSAVTAALKSAQSVKLSGTVTEGGKILKIDLGLFRSGALSGSLTGPYAGRSDISFDVIVTGGAAYILVDKQFFKSVLRSSGIPASACTILCGKYVKVPAKQFGGLNMNGLINHSFNANMTVSPTVKLSAINGQPAYRLADTEGDFLYVAKNGTHFPIEITRPGTGTLFFSEWNSVPPISAPPARQVISVPGAIG
jgi:hypothetical protein